MSQLWRRLVNDPGVNAPRCDSSLPDFVMAMSSQTIGITKKSVNTANTKAIRVRPLQP